MRVTVLDAEIEVTISAKPDLFYDLTALLGFTSINDLVAKGFPELRAKELHTLYNQLYNKGFGRTNARSQS